LPIAVINALSCGTSPADGWPSFPSRPGPFQSAKSALVTSANIEVAARAAGFRLRFGDGRFASAPFPPALRLRCTFPFAEPQAEALC